MTPQQQHRQRCETCEKRRMVTCPVVLVKIAGFHDQEYQEGFAWDITSLVGCASHTSAQQQRIEQVIRELESRCEGSENAPEYTRAVCDGYREALALLQAGDEHE